MERYLEAMHVIRENLPQVTVVNLKKLSYIQSYLDSGKYDKTVEDVKTIIEDHDAQEFDSLQQFKNDLGEDFQEYTDIESLVYDLSKNHIAFSHNNGLVVIFCH